MEKTRISTLCFGFVLREVTKVFFFFCEDTIWNATVTDYKSNSAVGLKDFQVELKIKLLKSILYKI